MKATLTPAKVIPQPEASVTVTMTASEAKAIIDVANRIGGGRLTGYFTGDAWGHVPDHVWAAARALKMFEAAAGPLL